MLDSNSTKESDFIKFPDSQPIVPVENEQDRKCSLTRGKTDTEVTREEAIDSHTSVQRVAHDLSTRDHEDDMGNHRGKITSSAIMTPFEQSVLEDSGPSVNGISNDLAFVPVSIANERAQQRQEDTTSHGQSPMDFSNMGKSYPDKNFSIFPLKDKWKPASGMSGQNYPQIPIKDSNVALRNFYQGKKSTISYTAKPIRYTCIYYWKCQSRYTGRLISALKKFYSLNC